MGKTKMNSNSQTGYEWIGKRLKNQHEDRFVVLNRVNYIMHSPTPFQPYITTKLKNPDGVPSFILDLEREVYSDGRTTIIKK